jgi:hypothetical protein
MSKHLTAQSVELYCQHRLHATELLEADAHLSTCAACRERLRERKGTGAAVEILRADFQLEETEETEHPSYSQFTAYADHKLDEVDREILNSHLDACAQCAEVMQDLRGFVATLEPTSVVGKHAEQQVATKTPAFRERFVAFWRSQTDWMSWQLAGAAVALLFLVGISAIVWLNFRRTSEGTEVARVNPSPIAIQSPQPMATLAPVPTPTAMQSPANTENGNSMQQPSPTPERQSSPANPLNTSDPSTTIALKDGKGLVTVDEKGNINGLESLAEVDRQVVRKAVTTEGVEAPSMLASLAGSVSALRGGSVEGVSFPILSPVGQVVMTTRPTLRWGRLEGAATYTVSVFDRNFKKVAMSQPQTGTEWTITNPLTRGQIYTWQVTAVKNGEEITSPEVPAPEAKFMVLDEAKAGELERALQTHRDSHLTMGVFYARSGLLDEAEREFQLLLRDNPKSRLARKLLQSVRALRNAKTK